jgi:hypothetical protein
MNRQLTFIDYNIYQKFTFKKKRVWDLPENNAPDFGEFPSIFTWGLETHDFTCWAAVEWLLPGNSSKEGRGTRRIGEGIGKEITTVQGAFHWARPLAFNRIYP